MKAIEIETLEQLITEIHSIPNPGYKLFRIPADLKAYTHDLEERIPFIKELVILATQSKTPNKRLIQIIRRERK